MLYIALNEQGQAIGWTLSSQEFLPGVQYISRWDYQSFDHVERLAKELSEATNVHFIPVDNGGSVKPRFDVIQAPVVGDEISMGFNGDYYLCGKIKSISDSLRVITTEAGRKFYRRGLTGAWKYNQTWTLVKGRRDERNPHF